MTEQLYLTDAYCQQFEAQVTEQVEGGVLLDRSAFYPGGGGQPCDFGILSAGEQSWAPAEDTDCSVSPPPWSACSRVARSEPHW